HVPLRGRGGTAGPGGGGRGPRDRPVRLARGPHPPRRARGRGRAARAGPPARARGRPGRRLRTDDLRRTARVRPVALLPARGSGQCAVIRPSVCTGVTVPSARL